MLADNYFVTAKGTRDFYPEDKRRLNALFSYWRDSARLYGFEEYDAPVVEREELYTRKAGDEITQQLYNFSDKSGRRLSLRPEMTPSLARMVMARRAALSLPLKWYSIPQCWRYERTTRGRRRYFSVFNVHCDCDTKFCFNSEHYQWNMDIWGVPGLDAEAELLSALVHSMRSMGLGPEHVVIKVIYIPS
jgi:histidyl-tRNA synthetase